LIAKISSYIEKQSLLNLQQKVLVAVSGGADSVCLLYVLKELGYSCVVAHCNFHLRGDESDHDEKFVQNLAQQWSFPYYKKDFQTAQIAVEQKKSIELVARELRYAWFDELRRDLHCQAIAVAHHQDDVVETFLMNVVRGTGIHGLTGIKPKNGFVVRPLLCVCRNEIEDFLQEKSLSFVVDSTNFEQNYVRNKFRHAVIPLLQEINSSAKQNILTNVERCLATEQIFDEKVADILSEVKLVCDENKTEVSIPKLLTFSYYATILHEWLASYGFSAHQVQDIASKLPYQKTGNRFYSKDFVLLVDRSKLCLYRKNNVPKKFFPFALKECNRADFQEELKNGISSNVIFVDKDKLQETLTHRVWKEGDRFAPFGMNGKRKKVSDLLIDLKLSCVDKQRVIVLLSADEIVWVVGVRSSDLFRVDSNTKTILRIEYTE
jgi:tRNA(Ile)-lysidine synthase